MITADNFKTITQLRQHTLAILEAVSTKSIPIYIISRSRPKAVLLNIDEYGKLLELKRKNKELLKQIESIT